ncbi:MAG: DUF885 domain-containing protein [bacterium]|nr:DUF885 domain-containing protein [bacterium]
MHPELTSLIEEILNFLWQDSPIYATYLGIHTYDTELDIMHKEKRDSSHAKKKEYLARLNQFALEKGGETPPLLDANDRLDLTILTNTLAVENELEEKVKRYLRDATIYPELALFGIYILLLRDFAPLEDRAKSALARLQQVPRLLEEGKKNLAQGDNIPEVWTQIAKEVTQGGLDFCKLFIPEAANQVPNLKEELLTATTAAQTAFSDYLNFLNITLTSRSHGNFAIGKHLFTFLLQTQHLLPYSPEQLVEIGLKTIEETQHKMYRLAKLVDPLITWKTVINELKKEHPKSEELLAVYTREMQTTREFVLEKKLLDIPEGESLQVIATPIFEQATTPYAAYIAPAPFETQQVGFFWVTPVDKNKPKEAQDDQLKGHSLYSIPVTALHEGYPGHHLQFLYNNRIPSKVRKQFGTPLFWEGWALYCEEMMYEQGFYLDPKVRLLQLKDLLWRACRVVIDVQLHTGQMKFNDAVDMLVNVAGLEKFNAIREVQRYTQTPTQPMSYLIGKREILKLREEYQKKLGKDFRLKEFHTQLLSYGSIPLKLVKEQMLKE